MLAAIEGHKVMVHTLLQHGASVVAKDQDGCTALYLAASNGNYEAVKILAQQQLADINIRNKVRFGGVGGGGGGGGGGCRQWLD